MYQCPYSQKQIARIIKHYFQWKMQVDREPHKTNHLHTQLLDLETALVCLPPALRDAIYWLGMAQKGVDDLAVVLSTSRATLWRRYQRGMEELMYYMNGAVDGG